MGNSQAEVGSAGIQTKKLEIQAIKMATYTLTEKTCFLTSVSDPK
jgi:hypothetical protein